MDHQEQFIVIHLNRVLPRSLLYWKYLEKTDLSPQEANVAFLLITGNNKTLIKKQLQISDAVLKDCIRAIYQCFNVHSMLEFMERAAHWQLPG